MFTLPRDFTAGTARRWRRVPGLVLAEVDYPAGATVTEPAHHARFVLVRRGGLALEDHAGSPALFYCAPHAPQAFRVGALGARCLILEMADDWLSRVGLERPLLAGSFVLRPGLVTHLAHRLYDEFGRRDEVSRVAIESLALGVVAEASRQLRAPRAPAWLERVRAFVDAHMAERLLLATVAAMAGVHPVHFARTFKQAYQTTFSSYVRTRRLEFACLQLATTGVPLGEIALAAGFCDQSHFCRWLKRTTGLSPGAYRSAAQTIPFR